MLQQDPELTGLEQLRAMLASGERPGMGVTLNISLVEVEEGRAVFEGEPGPEHFNPAGIAAGGYSATLLDTACACAVQARLPAGMIQSTLELKVAFHRPVTAQMGRIHAEGRVLSLGRQVAFAEADLRNGAGRLLASATSTLLIMSR